MPIDPKRLEALKALTKRLEEGPVEYTFEWIEVPGAERVRIDTREITDALRDLLAEREEMLALLRTYALTLPVRRGDTTINACLECEWTYDEGHARDCRIGAFLRPTP